MHHARVLIFPRGECLQRVKAGPDFAEALSLVFSGHTENENKTLESIGTGERKNCQRKRHIHVQTDTDTENTDKYININIFLAI